MPVSTEPGGQVDAFDQRHGVVTVLLTSEALSSFHAKYKFIV